MEPCDRRQERSSETKESVESQLFRDDPIHLMGLDMTKTFVIRLVNPFNYFGDEYAKRALLIAMKGN